MRGPEAAARGWPWAWLLVGVQALALAAWVRGLSVVDFDEAHQLATAWGLAQGDRLYQEAWEFMGPLPFWVLSALYAWTGPSVEVARDLAAFWMALLVAMAYALARALGARPPWAVLASAGVAWCSLGMTHFLYHQLWGWGFASLGLWASLRAMQGGRGLWAFLGGLGWGLAGLCTAPLSLLGAVACLGAWAWGGFGGAWRAMALWALGLALPWLGAWAFLAWQGAGGALWRQVWWWPLAHYKLRGNCNDIRPLTDLPEWLYTFAKDPMPYPLWLGRFLARVGGAGLCLALPVAVAWWALASAWVAWGRGQATATVAALPQVAVALVAAGSAAIALRGRADLAHLLVATLPAWPLLAWWAQGLWALPGPQRAVLRAPALALLLLVALSGVEALREARLDAREGRLTWALDARLKEAPILQALAPYRGRRIVAFPGYGLAPLFAGLRPATRFNFLTPRWWGYHRLAEYQDFAADWRAHPPDVVLLVGMDGARAVDQWGGVPSLKGYRHVGQFLGPYRRETWDLGLWVREGVATGPVAPGARPAGP